MPLPGTQTLILIVNGRSTMTATYPAVGPDDDVTAELDRWTDTRPLTIVVDKA